MTFSICTFFRIVGSGFLPHIRLFPLAAQARAAANPYSAGPQFGARIISTRIASGVGAQARHRAHQASATPSKTVATNAYL
jgi:hypothetical protein